MRTVPPILLFGLAFLVCGCERQVPVIEDLRIDGYQIEGTVTDRIGNPIPNVGVRLQYTRESLVIDSVATREYVVTDPNAALQAIVVDSDDRVVPALPTSFYNSGRFTAVWNGRDTSGTIVPSGVYVIQYLVDGIVRYSYRQLVDNGKVTATDPFGRFQITAKNLPIDVYPIPFFRSDGSFVAFIRITNEMYVWFDLPSRSRATYRTIEKGRITLIDIMFD
jgi:hypothetical protein